MKRFSLLVIVALVSAGLTVSGCDLLESDIEVDEPADEEDEETDEEAEDQEDEDEDEEEEAAEVDQDMYVLAAYETSCAEEALDDEEEIASIREEVFARYGFTEESFEEAQESFEGDEDVELEVETRMEECDEETAQGFAEEGAGEAEDGEEDEDGEDGEEAGDGAGQGGSGGGAAAADPEPAATGRFEAEISGSDFEDTRLQIQVRDDFNVRGELRGTREGGDFLVPFRGEASESNSVEISGDRRGNTVEIEGRVTDDGVSGTITGTIHDRDYRQRFNAR